MIYLNALAHASSSIAFLVLLTNFINNRIVSEIQGKANKVTIITKHFFLLGYTARKYTSIDIDTYTDEHSKFDSTFIEGGAR